MDKILKKLSHYIVKDNVICANNLRIAIPIQYRYDKHKKIEVKCSCVCSDKQFYVRLNSLLKKNPTKSCGCLRKNKQKFPLDDWFFKQTGIHNGIPLTKNDPRIYEFDNRCDIAFLKELDNKLVADDKLVITIVREDIIEDEANLYKICNDWNAIYEEMETIKMLRSWKEFCSKMGNVTDLDKFVKII